MFYLILHIINYIYIYIYRHPKLLSNLSLNFNAYVETFQITHLLILLLKKYLLVLYLWLRWKILIMSEVIIVHLSSKTIYKLKPKNVLFNLLQNNP